MEIKEILDPKKLLLSIGTMVIVISVLGIAGYMQYKDLEETEEA